MSILSEERFKKYLEDTNKCPYCEGEDLQTEDQNFPEHDTFTQVTQCLKCNRFWEAIFKMTHVEELGNK